MADSKADFEQFKCHDETFKKWILSSYLHEPDYLYYKSALESIIEREMNIDEHDRTGKMNDMFLDEKTEKLCTRVEILDQFEQWVKGYVVFKSELDLVDWYKNFQA